MTHTYAVLEISEEAFDEIASLLKEAGYEHAFHYERIGFLPRDGGRVLIDMHGIAVAKKERVTKEEESFLAWVASLPSRWRRSWRLAEKFVERWR